MKKLHLIRYTFTVIIIIIIMSIMSVATYASAKDYSFTQYLLSVPDTYVCDSKSISGYTSFVKDNISIGISVKNNSSEDNVSEFTETQITEIESETIDSLNTNAGEGISVSSHALTTFSSNQYDALRIIYEGSTESDDRVYMEEYIITTSGYVYTIVFSADKESDLDNDEIDAIKSSFVANDTLITKSEATDRGSAFVILIISAIVVIASGILAVLIFARKSSH